METTNPDRLAQGIRLMLVILGMFLCILGWYRVAF
jgi:hypothetical protein